MANTARALAWIVQTLHQHQTPFQAVGGLAARAYGATRPITGVFGRLPRFLYFYIKFAFMLIILNKAIQ
jgi:hypothetical protein